MADIQIRLPGLIADYVGAQVACGRFSTVNEYLGALVLADQQVQDLAESLSHNQRLATLLDAGMQSGDGRPWSAEMLREMKQRISERPAGA